MMIWRFFRGWSGLDGRWCRRCQEAIRSNDPFGRSEGVCAPCRTAAAK
jgi:hypothetical protein